MRPSASLKFKESFPVVTSRGSFFLYSVLSLAFVLICTCSLADGREIQVPAEYPSIQGAIDGAAPGDTILVHEGIYEENLLVERPLSLLSISGAERTVIRAMDPRRSVAMVRLTDKVTVSGFTFESSDSEGLFFDRVIEGNITGNIARGNHTGIRLDHSNGNTITGNATFENLEGITLIYSNENIIKANEANDNSEKGILLLYSNDNLIADNAANDNLWNGITVWSSDRNRLTDNVALQNTYGIVVNDSKGSILSGNREMRRLYYLLPVALVYIAVMIYLVEKKLFSGYYSRKLKKMEDEET